SIRPRWSIEHDLSGANPVGLSSQRRRVPVVIPEDDGLLVFQPLQVTRRLTTGRVRRIALVYRPDRDAVVVVGGHMPGRCRSVRQGNLRGDFRIVPGPRNHDGASSLLMGADTERQEKRRKNKASTELHAHALCTSIALHAEATFPGPRHHGSRWPSALSFSHLLGGLVRACR